MPAEYRVQEQQSHDVHASCTTHQPCVGCEANLVDPYVTDDDASLAGNTTIPQASLNSDAPRRGCLLTQKVPTYHVANEQVPDLGMLLPPGEPACPLEAIRYYPRRSIPKSHASEISMSFFDDGKFFGRCWTIYYLWPLDRVSVRPTLWLLKSEVDSFMMEINQTVPIRVGIQAGDKTTGLFIDDFPHHPNLRPRLLCQSGSQSDLKAYESLVPSANFRPSHETCFSSEPEDAQHDRFQEIMNLRHRLLKSRGKAHKDARKVERFRKRRVWKQDLKNVERFLGLRPPSFTPHALVLDSTWPEIQAAEAAQAQAKSIPPISVSEPPSFPFEEQVLFVSIDIECYERDKSKVTEIGISTLDTLDLDGHPPGMNAQGWMSKIRARHFLIHEYRHLVNHEFVDGCPDKFEFGTSEVIRKKEATTAIASCFRPPYSRPDVDEAGSASLSEPEKRRIVLVGHDIGNDIRYLRSLGYDPSNLSNLHPSFIDTTSLYRALMHETDTRSLGSLLDEFDITPWHLHNGGNDACYTMQAMLAIAVRSASQGRTPEAKKLITAAHKAKESEITAAALARAQEEHGSWETDDSESWL